MSKRKWGLGLWGNSTAAEATDNITVSSCFPTGSTTDNTAGDCSGFTGGSNYVNITTNSTTGGNGTWITWPTTTWDYTPMVPTIEIDKDETVEVYITPDMICINCSQTIGMFCPKGHYIKTDSEEYRFAHSLTCNEKLGLRFRAKEAQGIKSIEHIVCPPQEDK